MATQKREPKRERKDRPASTDDGRELQLIAKAMDLAEKQIEDGTASSQVITHFVKAGSAKTKLEMDRLIQENELLRARVERLESEANTEELYKEALNAMRAYAGHEVDDEIDDY